MTDMALIIPVSYSTYGDSTTTEGPLRKYVLAQFRSDADLSWVIDLRAELVKDELKYKAFREARPRLRKNRDLWQAFKLGVAQATIIVSDPAPLVDAVRDSYVAQGGKEGADFGDAELHQGGAAALISRTPIAYLPDELVKASCWSPGERLASLDDFSPKQIQEEIGEGLKTASVFAARAHATFDVATRDASTKTTRDVYRSPLAPIILGELMSISRQFDEEHPASAEVLNRASEEIGRFIMSHLATPPEMNDLMLPVPLLPLVGEVASENIDHIQAADIAAGLAREILETADAETLLKTFEGVIVNGDILRRPR